MMRGLSEGLFCGMLACACNAQTPATTAAFTTIVGDSTSSSSSTSTGVSSGSTQGPSTSSSTSTSTSAATSSTTGPLSTSSTTLTGDDSSGADSSDTKPLGCQGKIDFLFVIEGTHVLQDIQGKLVDAFPTFIETIEAKFADFDYHIMVVEAEEKWGMPVCTGDCPLLDCKIGDPCCPWYNDLEKGDPCCPQDYPCDEVDNLTACDSTMGAGTVTPAGADASNQRCNIANGRRYMTKGQPNLTGTFACAAQVGTSGNDRVGDAVVGAVSYKLNIDGGCNAGFLRDDALLMVTVIATLKEHSQTYIYPWEWYDKVLVAKNGDPSSLIGLLLGSDECTLANYPCQFVEMFEHHLVADFDLPDYGPVFDQATDLVAEACEDFIPQ